MKLDSLAWIDHPENPLLQPSFPDWMIADPSVLTPDQSPDGLWYLFANAIIQGIQHFTSSDGIRWQALQRRLFLGIRPFVHHEAGVYYLFYEKAASLRRSVIACRRSSDLVSWSEATTVLKPQYPWEGRGLATNGNPCLVRHGGAWRLYFSAGWVYLPDCLFLEPRYIGMAEASSIEGPFIKRSEPLIGPSADPYFRSMGAGSMKVIPPAGNDPWYAFNNGIYRDKAGRSRSEIWLLASNDGIAWTLASKGPLLKPEEGGWKRALVYAMHAVCYQGTWRMYYNARDGWFIGKERIGMASGVPSGD